MKKLFVLDLLVKCVVLIISALVWFGPAGAAAQEVTARVATAPGTSVTNPVAHAAMLVGAGLLFGAVLAALAAIPESADR